MTVDVDQIRARHQRVEHREWGFDSDGDYSDYVGDDKCSLDDQRWPCDAIQLVEFVAMLRAGLVLDHPGERS